MELPVDRTAPIILEDMVPNGPLNYRGPRSSGTPAIHRLAYEKLWGADLHF